MVGKTFSLPPPSPGKKYGPLRLSFLSPRKKPPEPEFPRLANPLKPTSLGISCSFSINTSHLQVFCTRYSTETHLKLAQAACLINGKDVIPYTTRERFIYLTLLNNVLHMTAYTRHINTDGRYTLQLSPTTAAPYRLRYEQAH
jgi:hypothetical protein